MGFFKDLQTGRETRKEKKAIEKKEKYAESLAEASEMRSGFAGRRDKAVHKIGVEDEFERTLRQHKIDTEIREARQNLFIQRGRLLKRLITYNKEYKYILSKMPDTPVKQRELERCSTGSKNCAYALAVVENAIDRLDSIRTELEWKEIMSDLTKGYKLMNAISTGSSLMTRLAFWIQKAKADIKTDISVDAMEHYYGRPIDQLLEEQTGTANAADMLVNNSVLDLNDEDAVLESVNWGTAFTVQPSVACNIAEQQSRRAKQSGGTPIFEKTDEIYSQVEDFSDMDYAGPSNMMGMI